jgi:hypothetical protein
MNISTRDRCAQAQSARDGALRDVLALGAEGGGQCVTKYHRIVALRRAPDGLRHHEVGEGASLSGLIKNARMQGLGSPLARGVLLVTPQ